MQSKSQILTKEVMKVKDERLKVQSEMLNSVKMVKIYAWEETMAKRVKEIRDRELHLQLKAKLWGGVQWLQFTLSPSFVGCACFFIYTIIMGEPLTAEIAFTALALFGIIGFPLGSLPMMLNFLIQSQVSIIRLESFLTKPEVSGLPIQNSNSTGNDPNNMSFQSSPAQGETVVEADFNELTWPDSSPLLMNPEKIRFRFAMGELVCVVGPTGSGKTGFNKLSSKSGPRNNSILC